MSIVPIMPSDSALAGVWWITVTKNIRYYIDIYNKILSLQ